MDLWIRSQDKNRLIKVEDLYIVHNENDFCDYIGNSLVGHLAKYTKKGRALEVLDEIQNILKPKLRTVILNNQPIISDLVYRPNEEVQIMPLSNVIVYEMPKE